MDSGYPVHLANPLATSAVSRLKHADDRHDAYWLAQMLRLGSLPQGYIYPKEERPVRDLLRKRRHLVKLRTSFDSQFTEHRQSQLRGEVFGESSHPVERGWGKSSFGGKEDLALAGQSSKEMIDQLTRQIRKIEGVIVKRIEMKRHLPVPAQPSGVGKDIGLDHYAGDRADCPVCPGGDYASYCRKVPSRWTATTSRKEKGTRKNGNKYLAWAFSEAAEFARRYDEQARSYYTRKMRKTNVVVAHSALAHKLSRAGLLSDEGSGSIYAGRG